METWVATELLENIFPFLLGIVGIIVAELAIHKIKEKKPEEKTIRVIIDKNRKKFPKLSDEVIEEIEKLIPDIVERHINKDPSVNDKK